MNAALIEKELKAKEITLGIFPIINEWMKVVSESQGTSGRLTLDKITPWNDVILSKKLEELIKSKL